MKFSIEKKGYNKAEVDAFFAERDREARNVQDDQIDRIRSLRKELDEASSRLADYQRRESQISNAIVVAAQKAEEIERAARTKYEAEMSGLKAFHAKWMQYYARLMEKYPLDDTLKKTGRFNDAMTKILEKLESVPQGYTPPRAAEEAQYSDETVRIESGRGINMQAVTSVLSDATEEDARFSRIASAWTRDFTPKPVKEYMDEIDARTGVKASALKTEGTNGFSFDEALYPTDSLDDIMSDLGIDVGDEESPKKKKRR